MDSQITHCFLKLQVNLKNKLTKRQIKKQNKTEKNHRQKTGPKAKPFEVGKDKMRGSVSLGGIFLSFFFSFVSKEFFIRLNLSLEFEVLYSQLVSTPIKKQCIHINSLVPAGSVCSPLAVDTMPGDPDFWCKRI